MHIGLNIYLNADYPRFDGFIQVYNLLDVTFTQPYIALRIGRFWIALEWGTQP